MKERSAYVNKMSDDVHAVSILRSKGSDTIRRRLASHMPQITIKSQMTAEKHWPKADPLYNEP